MRFEDARLRDLIGVEIDADHRCRFDERDDVADFVEVHAAAAAEAVDDLLHPRRARFGRRRDDYVRWTRLERFEGGGAEFGIDVRLRAGAIQLNSFGRIRLHFSCPGVFEFEGYTETKIFYLWLHLPTVVPTFAKESFL